MGIIEISAVSIFFKETKKVNVRQTLMDWNNVEKNKEKSWLLEDIKSIHPRRYLLQQTAIELYFKNSTNCLLNFDKKVRNKVFNKILSLGGNLEFPDSRSPESIFKRSNLTERWQRREISNFEYLMELNTIAGRTYNDLQQYPVFPWVLSDYTSETIDLNNPSVYRDLSKPIGALTESSEMMVRERYSMWPDPDIPAFHYGSHYSSSHTVCQYLVRMEPFTTYHIDIQGGSFDHPDRLFSSIPLSWESCLYNSGDVRELIPEFFYLPEFLKNTNNFIFGNTQSGDPVDDVILPAWASSPEEFIYRNREALESDYVSENLHHWIDLIFGYKQRGEQAIEACNVFQYLTYEGSIDIDNIQDPMEKQAVLSQIANFGQTPSMLLKRPHPSRNEAVKNIIKEIPLKGVVETLMATRIDNITTGPIKGIMAVHNGGNSYTVLTIDNMRQYKKHNLKLKLPFTMEKEKDSFERPRLSLIAERDLKPSLFEISKDSRVLYSGGHWDNSFKVTSLDPTISNEISNDYHKDRVKCIALTNSGSYLVTGSADTTIVVWQMNEKKKQKDFRTKNNILRILSGHLNEIECIAVDEDMDVVVSGAADGTCIIHTLRKGSFVNQVHHPLGYMWSIAKISPKGYFILYSNIDHSLCLYNINGFTQHTTNLGPLTDIIVSGCGQYFICTSLEGRVMFLWFYNLDLKKGC
eukprot:TRINITY_DN3552_c0_g1_i1.p1 TRINITY_DN3552_c0_g1~~TRINITY_DN3552_c0_g1_i1.p1  ORF type:complete len:751 (-),score=138.88 TRINITY_DN3552_c0_g1_i1:2-2080(-)